MGFIGDYLAGRFEASEGLEANVVKLAKRHKIDDDRLAATSGTADDTAFGEQAQSLEGLLAPSELMQLKADPLQRTFPFAPSWRPVPAGMCRYA